MSVFLDNLRQICFGLKHLVGLQSNLAQIVLLFDIIFVEEVEQSLIMISQTLTLSIIFLEEDRFLK